MVCFRTKFTFYLAHTSLQSRFFHPLSIATHNILLTIFYIIKHPFFFRTLVSSWNRDKLTVSQVLYKLPPLYGNRRFSTAFSVACHWSLSWFRWTQTCPYLMIVFFFNNLMHQFFILIHLLHSCTYFEHYCAHLQEDNCINTASGIVTLETGEWSPEWRYQMLF